jgi:DNA-binding LacI/PurR family transcriptional regulator
MPSGRKKSAKATPVSLKVESRPASLKALSDHLGLSSAAISRVLNAAPAARSIPKTTQDRIFAAAQMMNYRPNLSARSLRNRRSQTIGVLVPEVSEGYATLVLSGIEHQLSQAGYFYFLVSHHHHEEMIKRGQRLFMDRAVEGIIAVDTMLRQISHVPTVTVSGHHEPKGVTNIVLNHRHAADLAIEHLREMGHRRVAFIKGQRFSSDTEARWHAIRNAAAKNGLKIASQLVGQLEGDIPSHEPGYLVTQKLLMTKEPFTALFAFNDISAIGAIRALREAGLRVPKDVSVVGFDDVQSAAFQNPGLTTVRQPLRAMGILAAQTVLAQIGIDASTPVKHVQRLTVDPELIVRESTCPPS